jgi:hypothetical protein
MRKRRYGSGDFERQIPGALKSTIDAHGPIDYNFVGSAAKRIAASIREPIKRERDVLMRSQPKRESDIEERG